MNYDEIIDGLNDDQIMSLYNDTIVDGLEDGMHTGWCNCFTDSAKYSGIAWGGLRHGGCSLMRSSIPEQADCKTWCSRHRLIYASFDTACWCSEKNTNLYDTFGGFYACR